MANTLAIKQYNGIKHTNDATDARFLAHLLRLNILPTGYIYPKAQRYVRDLLRRRLLLVRQRTAQLLSLQSMITRYTGQRLTSHQVKRIGGNAKDWVSKLGSTIGLFFIFTDNPNKSPHTLPYTGNSSVVNGVYDVRNKSALVVQSIVNSLLK